MQSRVWWRGVHPSDRRIVVEVCRTMRNVERRRTYRLDGCPHSSAAVSLNELGQQQLSDAMISNHRVLSTVRLPAAFLARRQSRCRVRKAQASALVQRPPTCSIDPMNGLNDPIDGLTELQDRCHRALRRFQVVDKTQRFNSSTHWSVQLQPPLLPNAPQMYILAV